MMIGLMLTLTAAAQEADKTGVEPQKTKTEILMEKVQMVQDHLDSTARAKVDPLYIEVPKKPWRVILRQKNNSVIVDYNCEKEGVGSWNLNFQPPLAKSVGFWAGYRGTGISYSYSLSKNAGRYFSVSSTGAKYGFNFRYRRFNIKETTLSTETDLEDFDDISEKMELVSPAWIRSTYINGYYVFNGRRYSQAAAYNQSVIQRRSAGSLLLGATWYQSSFDYDDAGNILFMMMGNNVGRIKVHQANIGVGYGYNWVPLKGLVVNAMVMPQLSVYERVKTYQYDFNYTKEEMLKMSEEINNGTFREEDYPEEPRGWESGTETDYSALHVNFDLRLGIAYNWSDYFVGLQLQMNNFNYGKNNLNVNITDAWGRLSAGVRF